MLLILNFTTNPKLIVKNVKYAEAFHRFILRCSTTRSSFNKPQSIILWFKDHSIVIQALFVCQALYWYAVNVIEYIWPCLSKLLRTSVSLTSCNTQVGKIIRYCTYKNIQLQCHYTSIIIALNSLKIRFSYKLLNVGVEGRGAGFLWYSRKLKSCLSKSMFRNVFFFLLFLIVVCV